MQDWYELITAIRVTFDKFNILLGLFLGNTPAIDIVILARKNYLYKCSTKNTSPYLCGYIEFLKTIKDTEQIVAYKNDKIQRHQAKWNELQYI